MMKRMRFVPALVISKCFLKGELYMKYPFECECGHKEIIEMPITQYRGEGHYCPVCQKEMTREISSMICGASIDHTGDFYRKVN